MYSTGNTSLLLKRKYGDDFQRGRRGSNDIPPSLGIMNSTANHWQDADDNDSPPISFDKSFFGEIKERCIDATTKALVLTQNIYQKPLANVDKVYRKLASSFLDELISATVTKDGDLSLMLATARRLSDAYDIIASDSLRTRKVKPPSYIVMLAVKLAGSDVSAASAFASKNKKNK